MAQATYREIPTLLAGYKEFEGNTMSAEWNSGFYCVYSYNTCIAVANPGVGLILDRTTYSVTTSHHQGTLYYLVSNASPWPEAIVELSERHARVGQDWRSLCERAGWDWHAARWNKAG